MHIILNVEARVRGNEARMKIVAMDNVGMQIEGPDGRNDRAVEEIVRSSSSGNAFPVSGTV
jgi:hypothetical protein